MKSRKVELIKDYKYTSNIVTKNIIFKVNNYETGRHVL